MKHVCFGPGSMALAGAFTHSMVCCALLHEVSYSAQGFRAGQELQRCYESVLAEAT